MDILGFEVFPSILIGCVYLAGGYLLVVGPLRRRFGWMEEGPSRWRVASWMTAVAIIFLALNGPLHALSDNFLFSAHMVQHMLLMLIMPPLLILGLPPRLVQRAVERRWVLRAGRFLTHPVFAFTAYNVVFIGWHFPDMYNWALMDHTVHIAQHLMFMGVAVMMWWPVFNPAPKLERIPTGPLLMVYVFAFGIPSTAVSAFITLSDDVFYSWYAAAPRVIGLSPLDDQRLGGLIMWIPGMLIFWLAISIVFFRWNKDEFREWKDEAEAFDAATLTNPPSATEAAKPEKLAEPEGTAAS
jgi:putative membrane protein